MRTTYRNSHLEIMDGHACIVHWHGLSPYIWVSRYNASLYSDIFQLSPNAQPGDMVIVEDHRLRLLELRYDYDAWLALLIQSPLDHWRYYGFRLRKLTETLNLWFLRRAIKMHLIHIEEGAVMAWRKNKRK